jgi:hypothetical protein
VPAAELGDAQRLLALLEQGLDGVGKTGARASFEPLGKTPVAAPMEIAGRSGEYAVVLLTPACLIDARSWSRSGTDAPNGARLPGSFTSSSGLALVPDAKLESFFASQRYAGGYLARRRRAHGGNHYYPFLITDAGSVFRLSNVRDAALDRLARLCGSGLPPALIEGRTVDWKNCPYVPQNGYGRIAADHLSGATGVALMQEVSYV